MIDEVHVGPHGSFLAALLNASEDVHEDDDDESEPAEQSRVGSVVEGWIY